MRRGEEKKKKRRTGEKEKFRLIKSMKLEMSSVDKINSLTVYFTLIWLLCTFPKLPFPKTLWKMKLSTLMRVRWVIRD